jgi:predicted enzyme related to lactoylglutathione lyase
VCGLSRVGGEPSGRGARACLETSDLEDMGWYALFTDPSGVTLGLWTGTPPT